MVLHCNMEAARSNIVPVWPILCHQDAPGTQKAGVIDTRCRIEMEASPPLHVCLGATLWKWT